MMGRGKERLQAAEDTVERLRGSCCAWGWSCRRWAWTW